MYLTYSITENGGQCRALARALLAFSLRRVYGAAMPDIAVARGGKPYFPERPDIHFSLSHTRAIALCAVSDAPVGADVQARDRPPPERHLLRLMDDDERRHFDFFELWVLRESYFKLTGEGDLRSIRFSVLDGSPVSVKHGVPGRLYGEIPGCSAAVCAYDGDFPEKVIEIPPDLLYNHL